MSKHRHFRLTRRDERILAYVYALAVASTNHIAALLFAPVHRWLPSSLSRCQERLQKLTAAGYLRRIEQMGQFSHGKLPYVYLITRQGADLVARRRGEPALPLRRQPRALALSHLLATNDIRVAMERAAQQHGWPAPHWMDERSLRGVMHTETVSISGPQGGVKKVSLVPDGYCVLDIGRGRQGFFMAEADLGVEQIADTRQKLTTWQQKSKAYIAFVSSGDFTRQFGSTRLRILTVTTTDRRRANLAAASAQVGGRDLFWFTTFAQIQHPTAILDAPVWQVAGSSNPHRLLDADPSGLSYVVSAMRLSAKKSGA